MPISITAISGRDLARAGIKTTRDISLVTPGLTLQSTGPWLQPAIRGVTSQATSPGSEQNVAIYVDGVYQPFAAANAFDLPDVQRVEVLKGPQGTLFGRNATGGAIQVITLDPSFERTGEVSASYGRYGDTDLTGYFTTPLSDKVAISVAGVHSSSDGWNTNLLTNSRYGAIHSDIARGKVLVNVSDTVKFVLAAYYSKRDDQAVSASSLYLGNGFGRLFPGVVIPSQPYTVAPGDPTIAYNTNWGVSLRGTIDLGIGTITTTSAYQHDQFHLLTDGDSTTAPLLSFNLYEPPRTYSQEVVFASNKFGNFRFIAGGFAYYSENGYDPGLYIGSGGRIVAVQQVLTDATSFAGFAEGTYDITDRLSVIGGARYTYERRYVDFAFGTNPDIKEQPFDRMTPRVSLLYKLTGNSNVYATFSEGFKSGQYDISGTEPKLVYPEILKAYEVGYKSSSRVVAFSAAAFYSDYSNLQTQYENPITGIGSLQNAGQATIYGAESSIRYKITPEVSLIAQGAYTHATYSSFPDASVTIPITNSDGVPTGGNTTVARDLKGYTLARAPRWTGNIGANYDRDFGPDTLSLSSLAYFSSTYAIENGNRIRQPGYVQINANASWTFNKIGLTVGLYGKNLSDRKVFLSNSILSTGDNVSYQEPQSYGVTLRQRF